MGFLTKFFGQSSTTEQAGDVQAAEEVDFADALSMHLHGETEAALAAYQKLATDSPEDPLPPFFAAAVKAAKGNIAESAAELRALSGRIAERGEVISKVISADLVSFASEGFIQRPPALAEVIVAFGDALKAERCLRESGVCFEIAMVLVPDNAHVLYKLGDTLHDLRMYDYAEKVLSKALTYAPNHWDVLYTYAVLLQDLGRTEEAIAHYERAVALFPHHANCRNNYGAALLRENRHAEALIQCSAAEQMAPDAPGVKINLGNIHLMMNDYERARACFDAAIELNANIAPAYVGLASVEQRSGGDPVRARDLYIKAIELNPGIPEVHQALGNLLISTGDREGLGYLARALQLNSRLKNIHRDFGAALLKMGERQKALEIFRLAQQQNPDDPMIREWIAATEAEDSGQAATAPGPGNR